MTRHIADVSFGKDSTAMLLRLLEENMPVDEVRFFNTGMEFGSIYDVRDSILPILSDHRIQYVECGPKFPMWWDMLCRPVHERKGGTHIGYGWCGGPCRWGTANKRGALNRGDGIHYVGIAADEPDRVRDDPTKRYPLVEWGMTESDCLAYCYRHGFNWIEDGVRLYDVLDRVSCWCCRNKNFSELRAMREHLPRYYRMLEGLEATLGTMKSKPLDEITAQMQIRNGG